MNTVEIARAFGVKRLTVHRWIEAGCPAESTTTEGGRRGRVMDIPAVKAWLLARGITTRRIPPADGTAPPATEKPERPVKTDALEARLSLTAALADAKKRHAYLQARFAREAHSEAPDPAVLKSYGDQLNDAIDTIRKVEKDLPAIQRQAGILVDAQEASDELADVAGEIKTALLSIPAKLAQEVAGKPPDIVFRVLDDEIRAAMRRLSALIEKRETP